MTLKPILNLFHEIRCNPRKMGFSLTVMLSFVVLLTLVTDNMSTSSKTTSLLEVYITIILFSSVFSVILTCISVVFFNKGEDETPTSYQHTMCKVMNAMMFQKRSYSNGNAVAPQENGAGVRAVSSNDAAAVKINIDEPEADKLTYSEVSKVMDAFLLRLYMSVTALLTFIFVLAICFGAQAATVDGELL